MKCAAVRNSETIRALSNLNYEQRLALLKVADKKVIEAICECVINTLRGNVPLKPCEKKKLSKHKKILRVLGIKKGNWKSKKRAILQTGGAFLPALLAPLVGGLLSSLF
jgi:hypothetical protein